MSTQVTKREHPLTQYREFLEQRAPAIKASLPAHIPVERFIRALVTAAQINPDLLGVDRQSLHNAAMLAANQGLVPDGVEAVIVPYKTKASYQPMYQGLLKLFRQSGQFKNINALIVYRGEPFEHWVDETGQHFRHVPGTERDPKNMVRVYASAQTKDGGFFFLDMVPSELDRHKALSRASRDDAPWKQWPEAMAKKTVLKALAKYLPKSSDLEETLRQDELGALGVEVPAEDESRTFDPGESVGKRLDHFADTRPPSSVKVVAREGRAGDPTSAVVAGPVEIQATETDPIVAAYKAGLQARADGLQRRAYPGEYRDAEHADELGAWLKGWDGFPLNPDQPDREPDLLGGA